MDISKDIQYDLGSVVILYGLLMRNRTCVGDIFPQRRTLGEVLDMPAYFQRELVSFYERNDLFQDFSSVRIKSSKKKYIRSIFFIEHVPGQFAAFFGTPRGRAVIGIFVLTTVTYAALIAEIIIDMFQVSFERIEGMRILGADNDTFDVIQALENIRFYIEPSDEHHMAEFLFGIKGHGVDHIAAHIDRDQGGRDVVRKSFEGYFQFLEGMEISIIDIRQSESGGVGNKKNFHLNGSRVLLDDPCFFDD